MSATRSRCSRRGRALWISGGRERSLPNGYGLAGRNRRVVEVRLEISRNEWASDQMALVYGCRLWSFPYAESHGLPWIEALVCAMHITWSSASQSLAKPAVK